MADHAEQIELSPEDLAFVVAEAARCGKSASEVVHDALQARRSSGEPKKTSPSSADDSANRRSLSLLSAYLNSVGSGASEAQKKVEAWLADPDGGGIPDDDPFWTLVGIAASDDGVTDVSRNKKFYLYGPDIAASS